MIYHYTNAKALLSILEENSFRATNIRHFPDRKELVWGLRPLYKSFCSLLRCVEANGIATFLFKKLDEFKSQHPSINVISFCTERNYSYMWNHYAKDDGCCICFNKARLLEAFNRHTVPILIGNRKVDYPLKPINESFLKCRYLPDKTIPYEAERHLSVFKFKRSDGTGESSYLNKSNVRITRATKEMINDPDGTAKRDAEGASILLEESFISLIGIALCTKMSKTEFNYEKEKEERLVFYPPQQYQQTIGTYPRRPFKRQYIKIQLDRKQFLSSIEEILINPRANKEILNEIDVSIKKFYIEMGLQPPPVLQIASKKKKAYRIISVMKCVNKKKLCYRNELK